MNIKESILEYAKTLNLDLIGFTKCRKFNELYDFYENRKINGLENEFEEQDIEKRINPKHYMEDGKTIISIAFPYLHDICYKDNGFSIYTRGLDYHKVVNSYLNKLCEYIKSLGGKALAFVDSNTLPERHIAYLSGIGFIGKNNMLITKEYGSFVFLGEIITDLEMDCIDNNRTFIEINKFKECGECEICYKNCPTKAINKAQKNCNICMSYITQKKEIDNKFFKIMNGRIFGCDSCQNTCPYNKNIKYSTIDEFMPLDFMTNYDLESLIKMTNGEFKRKYKNTSCGWRGKNTIIRNGLIRLALYENRDITSYKFNSENLNDYKNRLLQISKL